MTRLRAASQADVPALVALGRSAFVAKFGHIYAPEDLAAFLDEARSPECVSGSVADPDNLYLLAERDDTLLGYCALYFDEDFEERPDPRPQLPCLLSQLYTAPDLTGQGIGALLMDRAIAQARAWGCDEIQLSVWSENFGAQRFYERYGFAKVADIDFWVGNHRDDEFLYALKL